MTLREVRAQLRDWARHPPLYEMVRAGLGIATREPEKPTVATPADVAQLAAMFNKPR